MRSVRCKKLVLFGRVEDGVRLDEHQESLDGSEAVAQTQEAWDFAGRNAGNIAYNLYDYRLERQQNGTWQIVSYQFETLDDTSFQRTVTTAFSATATASAVPLTP